MREEKTSNGGGIVSQNSWMNRRESLVKVLVRLPRVRH